MKQNLMTLMPQLQDPNVKGHLVMILRAHSKHVDLTADQLPLVPHEDAVEALRKHLHGLADWPTWAFTQTRHLAKIFDIVWVNDK